MHTMLICPRVLDIAAVTVLRDEWLAASPFPSQLVMDCSSVEMVSAAGAQCIVAYQILLHASGSALLLEGVSERMNEDLCLLGMQQLMQSAKEEM